MQVRVANSMYSVFGSVFLSQYPDDPSILSAPGQRLKQRSAARPALGDEDEDEATMVRLKG